MKKNVFGRQFKRDANERKALFKNLLTDLVVKESIKTTEAKAKAIKGAADKLITKAKTGGQNAYRLVEADVNRDAAVKLVEELAARFKDRAGGYTRIVKMGRRVADNAPMAVIEWVEKPARIATQSVAGGAAKKAEPKKETKKVEKKAAPKKSVRQAQDKAVKKDTKKK